VCLLNDYEVRSVGCDIKKYEEACVKQSVDLIKYPIIEMAPPEDLNTFHELVKKLAERLQKPGAGNILLHCRGGVGRAGLLGCCISMLLFPQMR
jgi:protein-tyrosine phosphatase